MHPFLLSFLQKLASERLKSQRRPLTHDTMALELRSLVVEVRSGVKSLFFMALGVLSAAFGLRGFLLPNDFIDGGVTGISLLVQVQTGWNLGILLVAINLPFLVLGIRVISWSFAIKSIFAIALLAIVVHSIAFPVITEDKLLIAVFGGFFLGLGIGLSIRGGAVIDGTEVLAVFLSRKTSLTIGDIILIFNLLIFTVGAWLLGIEIALYAILTYLAASKTVDFIIDGIEEYIGVTIISPASTAIREIIINRLGRACTVYLGRGGKEDPALGATRDILFAVVTRLEITQLKTEIEKIDPAAFFIMSSIKDTKGGMVKKRPLH